MRWVFPSEACHLAFASELSKLQMSTTVSQNRYVLQGLYAIKGREVIFNKQPSICIYRLKERFSLQNDPLVGGFTMFIFGSRRMRGKCNMS